MHGAACVVAWEDDYACIGALTCEKPVGACGTEVFAIDTECAGGGGGTG